MSIGRTANNCRRLLGDSCGIALAPSDDVKHTHFAANWAEPKEVGRFSMATNAELVATILAETRACQNPTSPESEGRRTGRYAPLGAHVPGEGGGYPTTDAAMSALAELADRARENDTAIKLAIGRDQMRVLTSRVVGELLPELSQEPDPAKHWPIIREHLKSRVQGVGRNIVHYVPVWLFLRQQCAPFSIGPVRFIERKDWLDAIATQRGQESSWMPGVRTLWTGGRIKGGSWQAGFKAAARQLRTAPMSPSVWVKAFAAARRFSEPKDISDALTVAKLIHPDQWVACAAIEGFEQDESYRRGLLAVRLALDTIRLVLAGSDRRIISTAADSVVPLSVERLSQVVSRDLAHGWRLNLPGLSGAPGVAQSIVDQAKPLFDAAGACIAAAVTINPMHRCPTLADRWFNAAHWFGRACIADADFVAVVMLVIALDVLCGGLEEKGIIELTARLTNTPMSAIVLPDGTTLKKLVEKCYKLRSEVAHGSVLALHKALDVERAQLESLAGLTIAEYSVQLQAYSQSGGADDRDAFCASLPKAQT